THVAARTQSEVLDLPFLFWNAGCMWLLTMIARPDVVWGCHPESRVLYPWDPLNLPLGPYLMRTRRLHVCG
ncbi:hypothetical protein K525DRAFT_259075, partial [Schizophyllum commune Loenen D]